ncbi:MAG: response regulator [Desulfatitalea sp.]|nr:response regulator [Desulfatitalea sp.]
MAHKILTVDDSRTIRMIVKNAFKPYECELFEAENGRDGLALAAQIKPDLIILDITMPVMTGIEMLTKLLQNEALKGIKVIMLTAESGRDNVMNIVKLGVKDYIVKPFKGDQLIDRVKLVLNDLKERIELGGGQIEGETGEAFTVDGDIVIFNLPAKITGNKATEIEGLIKQKINQMASAGVHKLILNLIKIENLNMTAAQTVLSLINLCARAKLALCLAANESQMASLKGFKETSTIPTKFSIEEAKLAF